MLKKFFLAISLVIFAAAGIFAQDEWASDDWGSDDWGDGTESSGGSSGGSAAGGFWDSFKISGDAELTGRYYIEESDASDVEAKAIPELEIGLDYEGASTNFGAKINLSERTIKYNPMEILDEFHADLFLGNFVLSAGKMKTVWGKGDKLHVLDNFNANDYSDFLIPDYLDRRIGEYMFRVQYNAPSGFRLEGIYTPIMHSEVYAKEGRWVPGKVGSLTNIVTDAVAQNILMAAGATGSLNAASLSALMSASKMSADDLYPDTNKLEYGQFGFYGNFSVGMVDFGISYYNGHYKQVSTDFGKYFASVKINEMADNGVGTPVPYAMPELHFDRLQVFGLDAQAAAGPFTFRGELGYNLTKDTSGDDPWVRNNSISYLFGFDTGLPIHNLNINVQGTGNFVLKSDEIEDSTLKKYDVDYDPTHCYSNNKLVVQLKDTFYYEKVELLAKCIYGFERKDLVVMPELSYKIRDGFKVKLSGLAIHNFGDEEDSEFAGWTDNSFVQLSVRYSF